VRSGAVAVIAVVAAVLGGVAVLLVGNATGLLEGDDTTVYVPTSTPTAPDDAAAAQAAARPLLGNSFDPAAIYAKRVPGVVTIYSVFGLGDNHPTASAQGAGFVVDTEGVILTNAHVITTAGQAETATPRAASRLYVEFQDGDRVPAEIVGWDVYNDVGVIRVDPGDHALSPVPLGDSSRVLVGEPVAAIGSPFGNQNSLAVGVVSATRRSIPSLTSRFDVAEAIQVDAPINHGNSGGPLFDSRGRVIGINAQIRSESGNAEGVGFAIPINSARRSMEQLLASGRVAYAYIGITTQDVTPGLARRFDLGAERGALVAEVENGTPAADAGLQGGSRRERYNGLDVSLGGDLIVAIGGKPVRSADDVSRIVTDRLLPGQTVSFTVLGDGGERRQVSVRLAERPARTSP
jgi:S1-C subfamily serine protease